MKSEGGSAAEGYAMFVLVLLGVIVVAVVHLAVRLSRIRRYPTPPTSPESARAALPPAFAAMGAEWVSVGLISEDQSVVLAHEQAKMQAAPTPGATRDPRRRVQAVRTSGPAPGLGTGGPSTHRVAFRPGEFRPTMGGRAAHEGSIVANGPVRARLGRTWVRTTARPRNRGQWHRPRRHHPDRLRSTR